MTEKTLYVKAFSNDKGVIIVNGSSSWIGDFAWKEISLPRTEVYTIKNRLAKELMDNPKELEKALMPNELAFFNILIHRAQHCPEGLLYNQEHMGLWVGVTRKTSNEYVAKFCELGIIWKEYRGNRKTCRLWISNFFTFKAVKLALKFILPHIVWFKACYQSCICYNGSPIFKSINFISCTVRLIRKKVTQYSNKIRVRVRKLEDCTQFQSGSDIIEESFFNCGI